MKAEVVRFAACLKKSRYAQLLCLITVLGFMIRIYGIQFGKPYLYHVDEWKLVNQAGHLLDISNLNLVTFFRLGLYPPFFTYILAVTFAVYGFAGLIGGVFPSASSIVLHYRTDPFTYHLIGRSISAVLGTTTIPLLYLIGDKAYNKQVGLMAALFLAFTFIHVRNSHFGTNDITVTFFALLAFYFILSIYTDGGRKNYILAGIFSGIAIATKYNVVFIILPFYLAHLFLILKNSLSYREFILNRKLGIGLLALCLSFLVACPLPVLESYRKTMTAYFDNGSSELTKDLHYFDAAPILKRSVPSGDWTVETSLDLILFDPKGHFHAGLIIGFSDDDLYYWGPFEGENLRLTRTGKDIFLADYQSASAKLRIDKIKNKYRFQYRISENEPWIVGTSQTNDVPPQEVGLILKTWDKESLIVDFDYFRIKYTIDSSREGSFNEGDEFDGPLLNANWNWHVPVLGPSYSLSENPGYLRIKLPDDRGYDHWTRYDLLDQASRLVNLQKNGRVGIYYGDGFWSYITGNQWQGFGQFSRNSMSGGVGWPILTLSIFGLIYCVMRHRKEDILFIIFPTASYCLQGYLEYKAMRHLIPIVPFMAVFSGVLINSVATKLKVLQKWKDIVLVSIVLIVILPMAIDSLRNDYKLTQKDTRTIAKEWIEDNIEAGSRIAVEKKCPQLYNSNKYFAIMGPRLMENNNIKDPKVYYLIDARSDLFSNSPDGPVKFDVIEELRNERAEYIILDDWTYKSFFDMDAVRKYPSKTRQRRAFYEWIEANCELVKRFDPVPWKRPGPIIKIYHINGRVS